MSDTYTEALALLAAERRDLPGARRLLRQAAADNADAALAEVALAANGTGAEADWPLALCYLQEAAARHGGIAAGDLAMIEAMQLDSWGNPAPVPPAEVLSTKPSIKCWRGFLSPPECLLIGQSITDLLAPSQVADTASGQLIPHPIRDSSAAPIGPTRESLPIQAVLRRIAAVTGTKVRQGESLTVLHYAPGQQYRMHMDALPRTANQRVATMLLYLNDGFTGGETRFEASGLTFAPRAGDALFFENVLADGTPDPASRHAGLPVTSGYKWLASRWIRAREFDVWQGPEVPLG